jgi:hypothetical protein
MSAMTTHTGLLRAEVAAAIPSPPPDRSPITAGGVSGLPAVVQRYLRFMGVVGRPPDWSFRARFRGRFRLRPGRPWMPMEASQYNSATEVARIYQMRITWARIVPILGSDTYLRGRGRMRGKLLNVFTVADGEGPEFDLGELATYLNDAILLAPSMLLRPSTSWTEVDDRSFDVRLGDAGLSVTARVRLDAQGAPSDFSTSDRYAALPDGLVRARWTTPISGWDMAGERPLPAGGAAVWHLPEGPFTYAEGRFLPGTVDYNVAPGVTGGRP